MKILRFPVIASFGLSLLALPAVTGCSNPGHDDAESSEAAVTTNATPGTFVVIGSKDKVVASLGGANDAIEAEAARPYGIGAIGAYILEKDGGDSYGVITAYSRDTGAARVEFVTNMRTKDTGVAFAEDLRSSLDEQSLDALLKALKVDLEGVERIAEANTGNAGGVAPASWWPWSRDEGEPADTTWCGTRAIGSLVSGVLGSAAFVAGAHGFLGAAIVTGWSTPTATASAFLLGGVGGMIGGVVLVGIGVVTLAYTAYVCATE